MNPKTEKKEIISSPLAEEICFVDTRAFHNHIETDNSRFKVFSPKGVICLTGSSSVGKTTTLLMLAKALLGKSFKMTRNKKDGMLLIKYRDNRILITTSGDSRELVESHNLVFKALRPDIFVCAVNNKTNVLNAIENACFLLKEPFHLFKIAKKKSLPSEYYANWIKNRIDDIINGL